MVKPTQGLMPEFPFLHCRIAIRSQFFSFSLKNIISQAWTVEALQLTDSLAGQNLQHSSKIKCNRLQSQHSPIQTLVTKEPRGPTMQKITVSSKKSKQFFLQQKDQFILLLLLANIAIYRKEKVLASLEIIIKNVVSEKSLLFVNSIDVFHLIDFTRKLTIINCANSSMKRQHIFMLVSLI